VNGETLNWSFYHKNRSGGADTVRMQATDGTNTQILANQTTGSTTVWSNNADSEVITLPTGIYDIQFVGIVPGGTTASAGDYTLASTVFIPAGVYDGGATSRFDVSITLTEGMILRRYNVLVVQKQMRFIQFAMMMRG